MSVAWGLHILADLYSSMYYEAIEWLCAFTDWKQDTKIRVPNVNVHSVLTTISL